MQFEQEAPEVMNWLFVSQNKSPISLPHSVSLLFPLPVASPFSHTALTPHCPLSIPLQYLPPFPRFLHLSGMWLPACFGFSTSLFHFRRLECKRREEKGERNLKTNKWWRGELTGFCGTETKHTRSHTLTSVCDEWHLSGWQSYLSAVVIVGTQKKSTEWWRLWWRDSCPAYIFTFFPSWVHSSVCVFAWTNTVGGLGGGKLK